MDKKIKQELSKLFSTTDLEILHSDMGIVSGVLTDTDCELERFEYLFSDDELKAMANIVVAFEMIASKYGASKRLKKLIEKRYMKYLSKVVDYVAEERDLGSFRGICGNSPEDFYCDDSDSLDEDCNFDSGIDVADDAGNNIDLNGCVYPVGDTIKPFDTDDGTHDIYATDDEDIDEIYDANDEDIDEIYDIDEENRVDFDNSGVNHVDGDTIESFDDIDDAETSIYTNFPSDVNGELTSEGIEQTVMDIAGDYE